MATIKTGRTGTTTDTNTSSSESGSTSISRYRLTRGTYTATDKNGRTTTYHADTPGQNILTLTPEQAKRQIMRGRLVKLRGDSEEADEVEATEPEPTHANTGNGNTAISDTGEDWVAILSEMSASDAIKAITQLDEADDVAAAIDAERAGKNRTTVLEAARLRMKELG